MVDIAISNEDIDELVKEYNTRNKYTDKHLHFDDARRHAIISWDDVQAVPGSGKTTLVAAKLLILAKKWNQPNLGVCVLTHTNVARDEIVSRLHKHPAGFKLTAYPHFIGTIQEFVNKYLALPYLRTRYEFKRLIENTEGRLEVRRSEVEGYSISQICGNLYRICNRADYEEIKDFLGSLHYLNAEGDLRFFKQNGVPENSPASSSSDRRKMLENLKEAMSKAGIFQFRDMYAFADKLLVENSKLISFLRKRFPVVITDEMQDTQEHQDSLLNKLFDDQSILIQRLGDPDQAIFDGIGGEEPNDSYENNEGLFLIEDTHRFGDDICKKIIGLSFNKIGALKSHLESGKNQFQNTIFIYDNESQERVLDEFGRLIADSDPDNEWHDVNAVGGVDGSGGYIRNYWSKFDKSKTIESPKPNKLIHIVQMCMAKFEGHISTNYEFLSQGVVDLLRKADIKVDNHKGDQVYYTKRTMVRSLKEKNNYLEFRKLLTSWVLNGYEGKVGWGEQVGELLALFGIGDLNDEAREFLEFDEADQAVDAQQVQTNNIYKCNNGRKVKVGTIHSVKGETHDATLVMETKYHEYDIEQMLPYFIDVTKDRPTTSRKIEFMRKLYVATSRPRHLLCLALHRDHITDEQIQSLRDLGWSVCDI